MLVAGVGDRVCPGVVFDDVSGGNPDLVGVCDSLPAVFEEEWCIFCGSGEEVDGVLEWSCEGGLGEEAEGGEGGEPGEIHLGVIKRPYFQTKCCKQKGTKFEKRGKRLTVCRLGNRSDPESLAGGVEAPYI